MDVKIILSGHKTFQKLVRIFGCLDSRKFKFLLTGLIRLTAFETGDFYLFVNCTI